MAYQSYEDLEVWQKAYKLSVRIYRLLESDKIELIAETKSISKMLHALIKSLKLKT